CLGSAIQRDEVIERDVNHRIQVEWKNASGVICNINGPLKIQGNFLRTILRSVKYRARCWAVENSWALGLTQPLKLAQVSVENHGWNNGDFNITLSVQDCTSRA
ncbi:reverse transcriptase, partial [Trifolium medium]|nr:reverse transcriptase [Trifolium medium]